MHGLINRSIQCFLQDTYGKDAWTDICTNAELNADSFEAMLSYDDAVTDRVLSAAALRLGKTVEILLEDIGTFLVSNPDMQAVRRLLRFGGSNFTEFLHSLDDLRDRALLAVPDLELPQLDIRDHAPGAYTLFCMNGYPGMGHVLVGVLRAMADEYGTLVMMDYLGRKADLETITIQVHDISFAQGREFDLAG